MSKQQETANTYSRAFFFSLFIWGLTATYITLREGKISQETLHHGLPETAILLLGMVLLIGPLTRVYDLFDNFLKFRKDVGLMAFIYALFHVLLVVFQPIHPLVYSLTNAVFMFGVASISVLAILTLYSFEPIIKTLNRRTWWKLQNWGVRVSFLFASLHLILKNYPEWLMWFVRGGSIIFARPEWPPLTLLSAVFVLFVIYVRLSEFLALRLAKSAIAVGALGLALVVGGTFAWGAHISSGITAGQLEKLSILTRIASVAKSTSINVSEAEVTRGFTVNLRVSDTDIKVGKPVTLEYLVNEKPLNRPIPGQELGSLLGKPMHAVGIREDLNEYFHIHPEESSPGKFTSQYIFTKPGTYHLWTWVSRGGLTYFIKHPPITVSGPGDIGEKTIDISSVAQVGVYHVTLAYKQPVVQNLDTEVLFDFHDQRDEPISLEPWAGAITHVSVFDENLSLFIHGHDINDGHNDSHSSLVPPVLAHSDATGNGLVLSSIKFPHPGIYRVYVDFRPHGIKLPEKLALHAGFFVQVE